jgi:hypothetical protein
MYLNIFNEISKRVMIAKKFQVVFKLLILNLLRICLSMMNLKMNFFLLLTMRISFVLTMCIFQNLLQFAAQIKIIGTFFFLDMERNMSMFFYDISFESPPLFNHYEDSDGEGLDGEHRELHE